MQDGNRGYGQQVEMVRALAVSKVGMVRGSVGSCAFYNIEFNFPDGNVNSCWNGSGYRFQHEKDYYNL